MIYITLRILLQIIWAEQGNQMIVSDPGMISNEKCVTEQLMLAS